MAFPTGWTRSVGLFISGVNVDSTLSNFPVLLTHQNLPPWIFGSARSDGGDIRASSDADGSTQIPVEIVEFDTTNKRIEIWVKPASLSTFGTKIYLWWGAPSETMPATDSTYGSENVWAAFEGAWHLTEQGDGTSGEYVDSTANDHDGVADDANRTVVAPTRQDFSKGWGKAQYNEAGGNYSLIEIPYSANFSVGTGTFGVAAWELAEGTTSGTTGTSSISWFRGNGTGHRVYMSIDADGAPDFIRGDVTSFDAVQTTAGTQEADTWYHTTWTRDSSNNCILYINGSEYGRITDSSDADVQSRNDPLVFLMAYASWENFNNNQPGKIAQPRYKPNGYTAAEVKADYHMQNDPASFVTWFTSPTLSSLNL